MPRLPTTDNRREIGDLSRLLPTLWRIHGVRDAREVSAQLVENFANHSHPIA